MTGLRGHRSCRAEIGHYLDSKRAPKGRTNKAQANGLGLQIVFGPSTVGAIYEATVQPRRRVAIGNKTVEGLRAPFQGSAYRLILETQAVGLGFVSTPLWGLTYQLPNGNR
jgi:hypothetical protein